MARDHATDLGHGEVDAVLHAGTLGKHRALHRPRGVETELALGALLGVDARDEDAEAQKRDSDSGDSRRSHE